MKLPDMGHPAPGYNCRTAKQGSWSWSMQARKWRTSSLYKLRTQGATIGKRRLPLRIKSLVRRKYKWVVLLGSLIITGSFAMRTNARENARQQQEAFENAEHYNVLHENLQDILRIVKTEDGRVFTSLEIVRENLRFARQALQSMDNLGHLDIFSSEANPVKEESAIQDKITELDKQLSELDGKPRNQELEISLLMRSVNVVDEASNLKLRVTLYFLHKKTNAILWNISADLLGYTGISFGLYLMVWAQALGKPGEAPEIKLG